MADPQYTEPDKVRQLLAKTVGYQKSTAASMDDGPILQAIADAEGEVDAVLRKKWVLPLTPPVPQLVVTIVEAIAAYNADLVFRGATPYSDDRSPVYLRLKRAQELLQKIDDGELDPGVVLPPDGGGEGGDQATVVNPFIGPLFGWEDFFRSDYRYNAFWWEAHR